MIIVCTFRFIKRGEAERVRVRVGAGSRDFIAPYNRIDGTDFKDSDLLILGPISPQGGGSNNRYFTVF